MNSIIKAIDTFFIDDNHPFIFIGGPCVMESADHCLYMAQKIKEICDQLNILYIFKSSFDKANRSSYNSFRGPGIEAGLKILADVKRRVGVPVTTDIHEPWQAEKVKDTVDIIQVPAFLCRQTDLLISVAKTGKPVNIKKGQFLSPSDMKNVVDKLFSAGNHKVTLTERGTTFGYNNLVVDMRSLVIMRRFSPVIFDATHSVQLPGGQGNVSGGQREFVKYLARSAIGVGIDGLFMEVHDDPDNALCDGPNMIELDNLYQLLSELQMIDRIVKGV